MRTRLQKRKSTGYDATTASHPKRRRLFPPKAAQGNNDGYAPGSVLFRPTRRRPLAAVPAPEIDDHLMRVFLRNTVTGQLLHKAGDWTRDSEKARVFRHSAEAMDWARLLRLKEVEILLAFEQPKYDVTLPLPY
jgi:hypothetical protein